MFKALEGRRKSQRKHRNGGEEQKGSEKKKLREGHKCENAFLNLVSCRKNKLEER